MTKTTFAFPDDDNNQPALFEAKPSIAALKKKFGEQISAAMGTLIDIEKLVNDTIDLMDKSIAEHDCYE